MSNPQYITLKNFVTTATSLAEQLQKDIEASVQVSATKPVAVISNETVVKLSRFYAAAEKFQKGIEVLNAINDELN